MTSFVRYRRQEGGTPLGTDTYTRNQDSIEGSITSILAKEILGGVLLGPVALSTTTTNIAHNLSRVPRGWIVLGLDASENVFEDTTSDSDLLNFLPLQASGAVNLRGLWVF